jgi:hypothetical protein
MFQNGEINSHELLASFAGRLPIIIQMAGEPAEP